jgi:5-methyltetrahydrofolate--homocysteine methyltransferase
VAGEPAGGPDARAGRSPSVSADNRVPEPPFLGTRIVKGIPLAEYAAYLDERATFTGQ